MPKKPRRVVRLRRQPKGSPLEPMEVESPEVHESNIEVRERKYTDEEIWSKTVSELVPIIQGLDDKLLLSEIEEIEERNPNFPPDGRRGVIEATGRRYLEVSDIDKH